MRIVIDLQGAQTENRFGEMGCYNFLSLAQAITRMRSKHEMVIALNGLFQGTIEPIRAAFEGLVPQENIHIWYVPGSAFVDVPVNEWQSEAAELMHEAFLLHLQPDVILLTSFFEEIGSNTVASVGRINVYVPTAAVLYDLTPFLHPDSFFKMDIVMQKKYNRRLASLLNCSQILVASDNSVQEVSDALQFDKNKITTISAGADVGGEPLSMPESERTVYSEQFSWDKIALKVIHAFEQMQIEKNGCAKHVNAEAICDLLIDGIANIRGLVSENDLAIVANAIAINHIRRPINKIFLDISDMVQRDLKTGVQRVTRSIFKELLANPPEGYEVALVYAATDTVGYHYVRYVESALEGYVFEKAILEPIDAQTGDIFLGLDLQHVVVVKQEPYLQAIYRRGIKVYFIVYDMLPILLPTAFHPGTDIWHAKWISSISQYNGVICISRAVAEEVSEWLATNRPNRLLPFKIGFFHLGGDLGESVPSVGLPQDAAQVLYTIKRNTSFLMVSTIEPRKGYAQVLSAFELLWNEGIDVALVIVGKAGWMMDAVLDKLRCHREKGRRLFWLDGISDEYLEKVYDSSTCLIAASDGEGFGLPLIEAAQHKLPIIARDVPVFREVAGEYAYYFRSKEPPALAGVIKEWLVLFGNRQHPESDKMPWLTWKQSAEWIKQIIIKDDWFKTIK